MFNSIELAQMKASYNDLLSLNPSKDDQLVFTFEKGKKKYNSNFYHEALTEGRASHEEIDAVLREIEEARNSFDWNIWRTIMWVGVIVVVNLLFTVYALWSFYMFLSEHSIQKVHLFFVAHYLYMGCILIHGQRDKEEKSSKIGTIMVRQNQSFLPRGLRWHFSCRMANQVKLSKEYQIQADDTEFNQGFSSSGTAIVFYFDPSSKKFESDFYSSEFTDGRAGIEEIEDTLSELALFRKTHQLRRILSIFLVPACYGLCYLLAEDFIENEFLSSPWLQIILWFVALLQFPCFSRYNLSKCHAKTKELNERFGLRGLKWQFHDFTIYDSIQWVELVKDYRIQDLASRRTDEGSELY